jgi:hypothetical protein
LLLGMAIWWRTCDRTNKCTKRSLWKTTWESTGGLERWNTEDASLEEIERCTRAYLLYLVGSTIFSITTGNKVPVSVMYLSSLRTLTRLGILLRVQEHWRFCIEH